MTKQDLQHSFRLLHGWLSAFAFLALCFFALTGLLLNHPDWLSQDVDVEHRQFQLTDDEVTQLRGTDRPAMTLAHFAASRMELIGDLSDSEAEGDMVGDEVFVRMQGVRGTTFLRAHAGTRKLEVTIEASPALAVLNELHRAERAGQGWRLAVDAMAILLIVLSLLGYLIFWSMRGTRLRTAIVLTVGSTLGLFALFVFTVS